MRSLSVLAAVLLVALQGAAADAARSLTPEGVWLHSNERIRVKIAPCGKYLCGKVVWLKNPDDETGAPRTDIENPDRAKRGRPVVGMTVLRGLERSDSRVWDGAIYNPDDGESYSARITVVDPDTLQVHAYVALPLLGKTQVWTRVGD